MADGVALVSTDWVQEWAKALTGGRDLGATVLGHRMEVAKAGIHP